MNVYVTDDGFAAEFTHCVVDGHCEMNVRARAGSLIVQRRKRITGLKILGQETWDEN